MHKAYKVSIVYFSLFTLLLLISGTMIFELKIGFESQRALSYYIGNDEAFIAAKSNSGVLKLILPHIFGFALLSMVVLHFVAFTRYKNTMFAKVLLYGVLISQFLKFLPLY